MEKKFIEIWFIVIFIYMYFVIFLVVEDGFVFFLGGGNFCFRIFIWVRIFLIIDLRFLFCFFRERIFFGFVNFYILLILIYKGILMNIL